MLALKYHAPSTHRSLTNVSVADGGQQPDFSTYQGPACPIPQRSTCGLCFKVDNLGNVANAPLQTPIGTVTVQVIDACPAGHAQNYCKTDEAANQRCQDPTTNSLDIDMDAYQQLTGTAYNDVAHVSLPSLMVVSDAKLMELQNNGHPNVNIQITPVGC